MMRRIIAVVIIVLAGSALCSWAKQADLAGSWYTSSPSLLRSEIKGYLDGATPEKIEGKAVGFIVPHAGFRFSGPVAAYAYKAAAAEKPKTVIVVGFTHRLMFPGIAVFSGEEFITPLGALSADVDLSKKIASFDKKFTLNETAFRSENSVEMQLPFVQESMPGAKVVLIAIGDQTYENSGLVADALYGVLKDRNDFVIIGSSDMCHYLAYRDAVNKDTATVGLIEKFEPDIFYSESLKKGHDIMCGYGAVASVMLASKKLGADRVSILKYANSGDTSGMKDQVVGYVSAAFVKGARAKEEGGMLTKEQQKTLLKIARDSINNYLKNKKPLDLKITDEVLNREMGAFVTLHENGELRGCIGNMIGRGPLYLTVRDMAVAAALEDPRFSPVTADEMDGIDIEISVLSPMERITDPNIIQMGKHGVMVRKGFRSGVYLPQVADETGWTRDEFMSSLCMHKAGLPADSWKKSDCEIYIFTAEVFGEKEQ